MHKEIVGKGSSVDYLQILDLAHLVSLVSETRLSLIDCRYRPSFTKGLVRQAFYCLVRSDRYGDVYTMAYEIFTAEQFHAAVLSHINQSQGKYPFFGLFFVGGHWVAVIIVGGFNSLKAFVIDSEPGNKSDAVYAEMQRCLSKIGVVEFHVHKYAADETRIPHQSQQQQELSRSLASFYSHKQYSIVLALSNLLTVSNFVLTGLITHELIGQVAFSRLADIPSIFKRWDQMLIQMMQQPIASILSTRAKVEDVFRKVPRILPRGNPGAQKGAIDQASVQNPQKASISATISTDGYDGTGKI